MTFWKFHKQDYEPKNYQLYILKNGLGDVLYIGISTVDVWGRWFGFGGHITWDGNIIYGESEVGVKVENHIPDSLSWKIQLWTLEDCLEFCKDKVADDIAHLTIHNLESIIINKFRPILNRTYNLSPGKDTTPKSKKEIDFERYVDKSYDEIFNKKKDD